MNPLAAVTALLAFFKAATIQVPHFAALVHHADPGREFAYDRASPVGHLDKALDAAAPTAGPSSA